MKKFFKIIICLIMALTLVGATACGSFGGGADGKSYSVTLNLCGGTLAEGDELKSYVSGEEVVLPTPTKAGDKFEGWYTVVKLLKFTRRKRVTENFGQNGLQTLQRLRLMR